MQKITLKKINDIKVKPIVVPKVDPKRVKGYKLFPEIYANIFICAKKKSGKTCSIFKILKDCAGKNTKVVIFSSTANKDKNMIAIIDWLESQKIDTEVYTSIDGNLAAIITEIESTKMEEDESEEEHAPKVLQFSESAAEIKLRLRKRKPKKLAPEWIFVFDDISMALKSRDIPKLVKQNRHYLCKTIISSQYPLDLDPQSRKQMDYWILFGGHALDKLEIIHKDADLDISLETFVEIYREATANKYNFLYVDTNNCEFRKNFNELFVIQDKEK